MCAVTPLLSHAVRTSQWRSLRVTGPARGPHHAPPGPVYPLAMTVPYKNPAFMESNEARPVRVLAEYLEPLHHFRHERVHDTIVFFGSARLGEKGPQIGRAHV